MAVVWTDDDVTGRSCLFLLTLAAAAGAVAVVVFFSRRVVEVEVSKRVVGIVVILKLLVEECVLECLPVVFRAATMQTEHEEYRHSCVSLLFWSISFQLDGF